jgi:cytoskeletal protein RodZ
MQDIKLQNDLGMVLKNHREKLKLSLEDVSNATRINVKYLHMMECNNFAFSSSIVVVRNYLIAYMKFLKIKYDLNLDLHNQLLDSKNQATTDIAPSQDMSNNFPIFGILVAIVMLLLLFMLDCSNVKYQALKAEDLLNINNYKKQRN